MATTERTQQATADPASVGGPSMEEMNAIVALFQQADWPGLESRSGAMTRQWPQHGFGWKSLGVALKMQHRDDEALAVMQKAAALVPDDPDVHNNLGSALRESGQHALAITHFERALALNPDFPDALNGLAITLKQQGDPERVISLLKRAIELRPTFPEAHYNLGNAIKAEGDLDEAVQCYMEALKLRPGYADAYNSLGNTLMLKGEPEEALACYRQSLAANPRFHEALNGMGNALRALGQLDEAILKYQEALRLKPDHEGFHHNLAIAYGEKQDVDAALASYRESLRYAPDYASSRAGLGMLLIANGQMEEGWPLYESRWEGFQQAMEGLLKRPETSLPQWRGEPVGKTDALLLFCEQGLGDSLQFIRYVPLLAQRFARVTVVCPTQLLNIFRGSFQLANLEFTDVPPKHQSRWQWHCTTMSVPLAMHTTMDTVPATVPYLIAPENRVRHWAEQLDTLDGGKKPRVGLVWAGGNLLRDDKKRSITPEQFLPLTAHHEMTWVSLQKANDDKKKAKSHHKSTLVDWMEDIRDFADTAALIQNLDLVITVDTAVAHLAGAMGKPVWMLNRFAGDFRWMFHRDDSPWYPSMRIFRQPTPGDWPSVLAQVQLALEAWRPAGSTPAKPAIPPAETKSEEPSLSAPKASTLQDDMQRLFDWFTKGVSGYAGLRDQLFADYRRDRNMDLSQHFVELLVQFGYSFFKNRNLEQACKFWQEVLNLRPDHHYALHHLGVALAELNRHEEACALFRRAIAIEPDRYYTHYTLAASLLALGHWEEGWRYYEYRWRGSDQVPQLKTVEEEAKSSAKAKTLISLPESLNASLKPWQGEVPAAGDALLLYVEQGFGDQIQFVRLLPEVARRFDRVDFYCSKAVYDLFAHALQAFPNIRLIDKFPKDYARWQWHCPLLSLPLALGLRPENIPPAPYLSVPEDRRKIWERRLQPHLDGKPLIGIAWTGSATLGADRQRSIDPLMLISLLTDQRFHWVCLQKSDGRADAALPAALRPLLIDPMYEVQDFADTAALIDRLDLVIAVDTSVAHLAGALGKPVWLLNRYAGDWRWMGQQVATPWYGSMRIFNQQTRDQWQEVIAALSQALEDRYPPLPAAAASTAPSTQSLPVQQSTVLAGSPSRTNGSESALASMDETQQLLAYFNSGELQALAQAAGAMREQDGPAGLADFMLQVAHLLQQPAGAGIDALPQIDPAHQVAWPADLKRSLSPIQEGIAVFHKCMLAQQDLPQALHRFAAILLTKGCYEAAAAYYEQAIALRPAFVEALTNLGTARMRLGEMQAAIDAYQAALTLRPQYIEAMNGLGVTLKHMGRFTQAIAYFETALSIQPSNAELLNNLGATLLDMHRVDEAIPLFRRSIAADPGYHAAHMGLALALLFKGEWEEGWRHYEQRWVGSNFALQGMVHKTDTNLPHWQGDPVQPDARLLVFCEQGLGDNLQFARYIPLAAARFAKVTLFCHAPLFNILAGSFCLYPNIEVLKALPNDHSAWDYHCYIMSMPLAFGTTPDNVPDQVPYLRSPVNRVQYWAERLAQTAGDQARVGLVWAGGRRLRDDRQRSIPLEYLADLLTLDGIAWISLQKEVSDDSEIARACLDKMTDWMPEIVDFADTAALIDNLDLVISVDTSVAHLAGALGKPVWLLNRYSCDWRWMIEREDSPWYPSMRIFNQQVRDDWDSVLQGVKTALPEWARSLMPARPKLTQLAHTDPLREEAEQMIRCFEARQWPELETLSRSFTERHPEQGFGFKALGIALKMQKQDAQALIALRRASELLPADADVHNNLANVLKESGDLEGARRHYAIALERDPRLDDAHSNLAVLLYDQGEVEQAIAHFEQALAIKPDSSHTLFNLGVARKDMRHPEQALACYEKAMAIDPQHHDARWNAALVLLSMGEFERGWTLYESRFLRKGRKPLQETPYPLWHGESLAGKRLLIQAEQGYGDTIQIARYLETLDALGAKCWFQCHDSLMTLIKRSYPKATVIPSNVCPLDLDYRIPMMSLPLALKTFSEAAIPSRVPYLMADPRKVADWKQRIASTGKLVGIAWRGNPTHVNDAKRSMPLETLLALVKAHPAIQFVSLQKQLTPAERKQLGQLQNILILDQELKDFDETAAVIRNLDLMITIDSVLLHLAGALATPSWGLLAYCPEWRWLIGRKDSPWYPGIKLFTQAVAGDWASLVKRLSRQLK